MNKYLLGITIFTFFIISSFYSSAQESVARKWNEELLSAIRIDFARPTVHARNLFHTSIAMYDAWAVYDEVAEPFLLGNNIRGFRCLFDGIPQPSNINSARKEAISYAVYRLLNHRFKDSPNFDITIPSIEARMLALGYDPSFTSTDYSSGNPAALGNYIAECIIAFGLQDGSNESQDYINQFYEPVNVPLIPENTGNPTISNPNRWQPLTLEIFIDQSGQIIEGDTPDFLSPEWGRVIPFALDYKSLDIFSKEENEYWVYHDPGKPPMLETFEDEPFLPEEYLWGFSLVAAWSSQLDPTDGVMWDISPKSLGNLSDLPDNILDYRNFYDIINGGDPSGGRPLNPYTGEPYEEQIVPRGDYARVLAEFWADGPESETPPGHWFTILNYVNDHPLLEKRFEGIGNVLDDLEWDVKSYFILGGTMHDAAISSWGIKGYYDYIRPISAIRYMADQGQSSDQNLLNYNTNGIPLIDGLIELVEEGDPLANGTENVGKIKLFSWKGPDYITDPEIDEAGVDWILAENWWPYQRPTFITPNFGGYISGHSTFSRAAAEVLTLITGDEYFPGGLGEFEAKQNEFLVFEEGPSVDIVLQWATYRDASDQTSLSRLWGGIHPPADDIPGRLIGIEIGNSSFIKAKDFFEGVITGLDESIETSIRELTIYPNPITDNKLLRINTGTNEKIRNVQILNLQGNVIKNYVIINPSSDISIQIKGLPSGYYLITANKGNHIDQTSLLILN